jgi:anti-sigma B factor antagonist
MMISTREDENGGCRLLLAGELDMATAPALDERMAGIFGEARPDRVTIDAAGLTFCDSSGIYALLRARETAHRHGAAFVLRNPVGMVRRTLEITGLLQVLATASKAEDR